VTLAEFARRKGVTRQAVSHAAKHGPLAAFVTWKKQGKKRVGEIKDVRRATLAWDSRPGHTSAEACRVNGHLSARSRRASKGDPQTEPTEPASDPESDSDAHDVDPLDSLAAARLQFEGYKAKLARLEFEKESGLVIEVAQAMEIFGRQIQEAKTSIMAIGRRARGRIPHLTVDDVMTIEDLCREALEGLAAGAIETRDEAAEKGPEDGM
jgi:hypothetical protein